MKSTEITDKGAINENIAKLKDLRVQYLISERSSELIAEFLNDDEKPYVQRKFKEKVSIDTHKDELDIHRTVAMENAKREIALLECRMKRWEQEINILKTRYK